MSIQSTDDVFREMPDHVACVVVSPDGDAVQMQVMVNPASVPEEVSSLARWIEGLSGRIEEYGLATAVEIDGWQKRSDGAHQLWVRAVEMEDVGL
jgi:hypothetical protein